MLILLSFNWEVKTTDKERYQWPVILNFDYFDVAVGDGGGSAVCVWVCVCTCLCPSVRLPCTYLLTFAIDSVLGVFELGFFSFIFTYCS